MPVLANILRPFAVYTRWLHTGFPNGTVERLPEVNPDGSTRVAGVYLAGDLTGVPLLKFAADSGARTMDAIAADLKADGERHARAAGTYDVAILGGGVAGIAAAIRAEELGLQYIVLEASHRMFHTIADFPKGKPIYAYPTAMKPHGAFRISADVKERLLEELETQARQYRIHVQRGVRAENVRRRNGVLEIRIAGGDPVRALRILIAIGRSGEYRKLSVPGEEKSHKVFHRLHDPSEFSGASVLVVGGGDSALEAAIAVAKAGGAVTLSYRKPVFSRPKPDNLEALHVLQSKEAAPGKIRLLMSSRVREIREDAVDLHIDGRPVVTIENDVVFTLIGRAAPLEFFRRSGLPIAGEWTLRKAAGFASFLGLVFLYYNFKKESMLTRQWLKIPAFLQGWRPDPATLAGVLSDGLRSPSFWCTLLYSATIVFFGIRRIRRRRTQYVRWQTMTLIAVQVLPLFFLPEIVLPWLGRHGLIPGIFQDHLFDGGTAYWRAYGFILAWPLFIWNVFTDQPHAWWLAIACLQTFVIIPVMIHRWGKGAYCGWICSCGAMAETMGDTHRHKMPHGPFWSRMNMMGQGLLALCLVMLGMRIFSWIHPDGRVADGYHALLDQFHIFGMQLNYAWVVDIGLAGIVGLGFYFHFSGRVWCRFFCPLAALMHLYARFSSFRILAEKKKCISCNVCTSVCHQGIDVMNFANKGKGMNDVECVRCSACVQGCPTGVLAFGRVDRHGKVLSRDKLQASPVRAAES